MIHFGKYIFMVIVMTFPSSLSRCVGYASGQTNQGTKMSSSKACLIAVYGSRTVTSDERHFDEDHDLDRNGNSFACLLHMTATQASQSISQFKKAFLQDSAGSIVTAARFPINVGETSGKNAAETPKRFQIRNATEWSALRTRLRRSSYKKMVECADLSTATIGGGSMPGFMIGTGNFWFASGKGTPPVKLFAINLYPLSEKLLASACSSSPD
jgi:hypothetical protein